MLVDVDGTLCDVSGVRHFVLRRKGEHRNFDAFHKASILCPPVPQTLDWVATHADVGRTIVVVTAGEDKWRVLTNTWLPKWNVLIDHLLMRRTGDQRPDVEVKTEILARIRAAGLDVVVAIDDNPSVIALWETESIPVTVVPGWDDPPAKD